MQKLETALVQNQAVFKVGDLIASDMLSLAGRFRDLDAAAKAGDSQGVLQAGSGVVASIQRMIDLSKREMENSNDPAYK